MRPPGGSVERESRSATIKLGVLSSVFRVQGSRRVHFDAQLARGVQRFGLVRDNSAPTVLVDESQAGVAVFVLGHLQK